ncbi:DUF4156 domain-containing protein [Helicobacter cinaedi]|uniref:DUF4156 domain-containing protein n=1 Tax=Helicobacter cinaedi TaxID=213 RepID=UPI000DA1FF01|nr:DUF4156 domain-containing protein [Helicobacter cinaedi]
MKNPTLSIALKVGMAFGLGLLVVGCGDPVPELPHYKPKSLEQQGKGITIAKSTPYNCKILGEVEGKDNTNGTKGATRELLREGALNDLRNEAGDAAGVGKRIMLNITNEEVLCSVVLEGKKGKTQQTIKCTDGLPIDAINGKLLSHRIHAQVFDCGEK